MPQTIDELLESARSRLDRLDPITARDAAAGAVIIDTRRAERAASSRVRSTCRHRSSTGESITPRATQTRGSQIATGSSS
jgi:hypothetical protein